MRVLPVLVAGLLVALIATPADALSGRLGAQVRSGGNQLNGELPDEGKWKGQTGLGASIIAELDFTPYIALSFQPGLVQRNSRQEFRSRNQVIGFLDYEFDYLSLPLLVRVTVDPVGTRGFVTAGLDLSILLDATSDDGESRQDLTDTIRPATLGALFGAGVMVEIGRNFLTVELRYSQGLGDMIVRDGSESDAALGSPSVKYRGFGLLAGFVFSLGGF